MLSTNPTQSPQTGDTPTGHSSMTSPNAAAHSPGQECRATTASVPGTGNASSGNTANAGVGVEVSTGALSPDALSQHSNNVAAANNSSNATNMENIPLGSNSGGSAGGSGSCCENGRPIMTDPVSGQTVCSCQYDSARLALSSYSRLPAASVGVYGTPYPSTEQNPYQSIGVDSSAFYSPLVSIQLNIFHIKKKTQMSFETEGTFLHAILVVLLLTIIKNQEGKKTTLNKKRKN